MATDLRKAKVTSETLLESEKLLDLWENTDPRPSQVEFGEKFDIGSQSAVSGFLKGKTPISLKAARGFAKGLQCQISDFSERLAQADAAAWPFALVDRGRYEALSPEARGAVQLRMLDAIAELERAALKKRDRQMSGAALLYQFPSGKRLALPAGY